MTICRPLMVMLIVIVKGAFAVLRIKMKGTPRALVLIGRAAFSLHFTGARQICPVFVLL